MQKDNTVALPYLVWDLQESTSSTGKQNYSETRCFLDDCYDKRYLAPIHAGKTPHSKNKQVKTSAENVCYHRQEAQFLMVSAVCSSSFKKNLPIIFL